MISVTLGLNSIQLKFIHMKIRVLQLVSEDKAELCSVQAIWDILAEIDTDDH